MKTLKFFVLFAFLVTLLACAPALQIGAGFMGNAIGKGANSDGENKKPEKTVIRNEKGEITSIIYNRK